MKSKNIRIIGCNVLAAFIVMLFCAGASVAAETPSIIPAQKITLDIKGMDVIDVLKIISQRSGMNIVPSKSVAGRVTIFLKDVDVWDAFEIILLSNDLAYDTKGNIVTVMTGREYEALYGERFKDKKELEVVKLNYAKAADVAKALNQVKTAIGKIVVDDGSNTLILMETSTRLADLKEMTKVMDIPTETRIFNLDYAKSDKLNAKIQDMVTKGLGSVKFDERTNTVIVTDTKSNLAEIEKVIAAFDEKTKQVLIEAKIVQVELNDSFKSGVDWKAVLDKLTVEQILAANLTSGARLTIGTFNLGKTGTFNSVVELLKEAGKTDIISSPRVTALDGQEAKILVGTKEAYITATTTTPATGAVTTAESVNFVDVGIQLYVTPTINKEGYVTMKIRPVVSSVGSRIKTSASPDGVPIVKTSEAETSVVVKNGVTIVMGGLMEDRKIKDVSKIPILGDIPILGLPFTRTSTEVKKTELVIFLTPTIISGDTSNVPPQYQSKDTSKKDLVEAAETQYDKTDKNNTVTKALYYQSVREKILSTAMRCSLESQRKSTGEAVVCFTLASDGSIIGEPKVLNAICPDLADMAVRSVKDSAPFGPFPDILNRDEEILKVTLLFE